MNLFVSLLCSAACALLPMAHEPQSSAIESSRGVEQSLELLDALDAVSLSVDYVDVRLDDVTADLSQHMALPMMLDAEALRMIGVRGDDRVTLHAGPASAAALLDALARELASGLDQPIWDIHAGAVVLTSENGVQAMRSLMVYDVRDLVADDSLFAELRAGRPAPNVATPPEAGPETQEEGKSEAQHDAERSSEPSLLPPSRAHDLLMIILEHLDPDAWVDMGGSRATITDHNGMVVVTAPARLHRQFRDALRKLRSAQAMSVRVTAQVIDMPREDFDRLSGRYRHEGQRAVALSRSELAVLRWQSEGTVTPGSTLAISSENETQAVSIQVKAAYERDTGRVQFDVKASMTLGSDRREASTVVAFQLGEGAAIIELPPAQPADSVRVLVVRAI